MVFNLILVQIVLLAPLAGGPLHWDLWKHYSPAVSSMTVMGVFLGQMMLTQAWSKAVRIVMFAASCTFLVAIGPWLQRAYEAQNSSVFSKIFFETVIADFGQTRYLCLVAGIFVVTLVRSLSFK